MYLDELFAETPHIAISNIACDAKKVTADCLFFCLKGLKTDGHQQVREACQNGAKVIIYHDDIPLDDKVIYIKVDDVVAVLNKTLKLFYQELNAEMQLVAVIGQEDKTDTAVLTAQLLNHFAPCAYIGTYGVHYPDFALVNERVPDPLEIYHYLAEMRAKGVNCCVIEANNVDLERGRIASFEFAAVIVCNLPETNSLQSIALQAFLHKLEKAVLIFKANDSFETVIENSNQKILTYGERDTATVAAYNIHYTITQTSFVLKYLNQSFYLETELLAASGLHNLLGAVAVAAALGKDFKTAAAACSTLKLAKGRMQRIDLGQNYHVLIDSAATAAEVQNVLEFAYQVIANGKSLIVVCGSKGGREKIKREKLGEVLDTYADLIILTEDDSKDENVEAIFEAIIAGIKHKPYLKVATREDALISAIALLNSADILLVLGKGDDKYIYRRFGKESYAGDEYLVRKYIKKRIEEENFED